MNLSVMRIRARVALGIAVALLAVALPAFAGTTGKITGVVKEKGKTALPGVTVIIEGTRFGAIADDQGRYSILNVPSGTYTLRGKIIGYADYVATNADTSSGCASSRPDVPIAASVS